MILPPHFQAKSVTANDKNATTCNEYTFIIASEHSKRGKTSKVQFLWKVFGFFSKTRQSRIFFSNPQSHSSLRGSKATEAIHTKDIDCRESLRDSRNDGVVDCFVVASPLPRNDESFHSFSNAKDTHPQTPSAREGVLREPSTLALPSLLALKEVDSMEGTFKKSKSAQAHNSKAHTKSHAIHTKPHNSHKTSRKLALSLATALATASINMLISSDSISSDLKASDSKTTKLCTKSIISSYTDFCIQSSTGYLTDFAPSDTIDFTNPTKQQNYTDLRNFTDSTPYAIPRPKDISAFLQLENWRDTYFCMCIILHRCEIRNICVAS